MILRFSDHEDKDGRLHNGYQILFGGDLGGGADGLLKVTLVNSTQVLVQMPSFPSSFTCQHERLQLVMERVGDTPAAKRAYSTAASKLVRSKSCRLMKVLIDFDKTGEELTNEVFCPSSENGHVTPVTAAFESEIQLPRINKRFPTTELYAAFNIARIETTIRMARMVGKTDYDDEIARALAEGMNMDDDIN